MCLLGLRVLVKTPGERFMLPSGKQIEDVLMPL
jgi:hypothetical protein